MASTADTFSCWGGGAVRSLGLGPYCAEGYNFLIIIIIISLTSISTSTAAPAFAFAFVRVTAALLLEELRPNGLTDVLEEACGAQAARAAATASAEEKVGLKSLYAY